MTEIPVVEPTEVVKVVPAFAPTKLVLLGLVGMTGALILLLIQALRERDDYRQQYMSVVNRTAHSPNGKFDGPVTAPGADVRPEPQDSGTAASEM